MKQRSLVALGLLLLWSATYAAGPATTPGGSRPPGPAAGDPAPAKRPVAYIDGVPDTGQFLSDADTLGRIDDRIFTVREYRDFWFASLAEFRPKADSAGRAEFLISMVNKEILAQLARQAGRPLSFEDRATMREHTQRVLSNIVFQRVVADSAQPSEEELRQAYEQGLYLLRLQHIVTADHATAERAHAELAQGRVSWPVAVQRYSIAKSDKGPEGELGWVPRTAFDPAVALKVYDLKDGQISDVFLDREGFQLVRVMERRPNPQPAFERLREVIANELMPVKIDQRVEQVRGLLRQRLGMVYDTTNITWAASRFGQTAGVQHDEHGQTVLDLSGAVPEFAPADTARLLARWRDGRYTLGAFLEGYRAQPVLQRQNVNTFPTFRWNLDGMLLEPYMAELGAERGLDRDPVAVQLIEKKREQLMVEHLFQDSVQSKVWITPEERQKYYRDRLKDFWSFQNVRFAAIARGTKAGADSVAGRLLGGEKAEAILLADSLHGEVTGSIRTMREDEHGSFYKLLFEEMRTGQVRVEGPDKRGDFVVIQKLDHDHGRQLPYEEVQGLIDESLQNIKAEQLLKDLLARHRGEHAIALHLDRLMHVRLVDPLLD